MTTAKTVTMNFDNASVWAMGKVTPGWYCASWAWNQKFFDHLKEIGYWAVMSIGKPLADGTPTDAKGNPLSA